MSPPHILQHRYNQAPAYRRSDKFLANQWEDEILTTRCENTTISNLWGDKILTNQWEDKTLAYR